MPPPIRTAWICIPSDKGLNYLLLWKENSMSSSIWLENYKRKLIAVFVQTCHLLSVCLSISPCQPRILSSIIWNIGLYPTPQNIGSGARVKPSHICLVATWHQTHWSSPLTLCFTPITVHLNLLHSGDFVLLLWSPLSRVGVYSS